MAVKLIALKKFSSRLKKGDAFEQSARDAKVLVALGVARYAAADRSNARADGKPIASAGEKPTARGGGYRTRALRTESA